MPGWRSNQAVPIKGYVKNWKSGNQTNMPTFDYSNSKVKYSYFATLDMLRKNNCLESLFEGVCEIAYKQAECEVVVNDKADSRVQPKTDWFWVQILIDKPSGKELIGDKNFIARPCPPFCTTGN